METTLAPRFAMEPTCRPSVVGRVQVFGQVALDVSADVEDSETQRLVNRGVSLKQLLSFYHVYREKGLIEEETTTLEVVKNIIVPETHQDPQAYMDSAFMRSLGGGQRAERFVSHAWKSLFINTILNVVIDATQLQASDLIAEDEHGKEYLEYGCYSFELREFDAEKLLRTLPEPILNKKYWLCIFAINQHRTICGNCCSCDANPLWVQDPHKHLMTDACLICGEAKFIPCKCCCLKYEPRNTRCETNKFKAVVKQMEALVVSLDPGMECLKRLWVAMEFGQASRYMPVYFRLAFGLSSDSAQKLLDGVQALETVNACEATNPDDASRMLEEIRNMEGGIPDYDQLVNSLLELRFGRCSRLQRLSETGRRHLGFLRELHLDFQWNHDLSIITEDLFGEISCFKILMHLCDISMNFRGVSLVSTMGLGKRLAKLCNLTSLQLSFRDCSFLSSTEDLVHFRKLKDLRSLRLDFFGCLELADVSALAQGLGNLQGLRHLDVNFRYTRLHDISEFGASLHDMWNLQHLGLDFAQSNVRDISALAKSAGRLQTLEFFSIDLQRTQVQRVLRERFVEHALFLEVFRYSQEIQEIVEMGFTDKQARDALANNDSVHGAVIWLKQLLESIVKQGFTEDQARFALVKMGTVEKADKWLSDISKIMDQGFTESQAQEAISRFPSVRRAVKWLQEVATIVSKGFPEGSARQALSQSGSVDFAVRWLTIKKITDQGFTEAQAMDALESQVSYEDAVQWLEDIQSVVGFGFTESDARHALTRAGSVEDAVKLLTGWRQRVWRCVVCPWRWMSSEPDEVLDISGMDESVGLNSTITL